jgi:hypothetical protein
MVSPTSGKFLFLISKNNIILPLFFIIEPTQYLFFRCMLHNFAAGFEMYGLLDAVAAGLIDALLSANSTMVYNVSFVCSFCLAWI